VDEREQYQEPQIEEWGSVADLTQTGKTNPGGDGKDGSSASMGE
jgi:hypothetical protein